MAERVSKRLLAAFEEMRQERNGTAGLVQCEGCPESNLVPDGPGPYDGLCNRHKHEVMNGPHSAEAWAATDHRDSY